MGKKITRSTRLLLEDLVQKYGEKVTEEWTTILNLLDCSNVTLYKELKLGLSNEDYKLRNYYKYNAEMAQINKE